MDGSIVVTCHAEVVLGNHGQFSKPVQEDMLQAKAYEQEHAGSMCAAGVLGRLRPMGAEPIESNSGNVVGKFTRAPRFSRG